MKIANTEIPHDWRYLATTSDWENLAGAYCNLYFATSIHSGGTVQAEKDVRYPNHRFGHYDMFFKRI